MSWGVLPGNNRLAVRTAARGGGGGGGGLRTGIYQQPSRWLWDGKMPRGPAGKERVGRTGTARLGLRADDDRRR